MHAFGIVGIIVSSLIIVANIIAAIYNLYENGKCNIDLLSFLSLALAICLTIATK